VAPLLPLKVPAGHCVQTGAPALEKDPAVQFWHVMAAEAPTVLEDLPAVQERHAVLRELPVLELNEPAGQGVGTSEFVEQYRPAGQAS
jgi:hypothetical protein